MSLVIPGTAAATEAGGGGGEGGKGRAGGEIEGGVRLPSPRVCGNDTSPARRSVSHLLLFSKKPSKKAQVGPVRVPLMLATNEDPVTATVSVVFPPASCTEDDVIRWKRARR